MAGLAGWPAELQQHVHLVTADVTVSMSLRSAPNCHLMQSAQMQLVFDTHTPAQRPLWCRVHAKINFQAECSQFKM